VPEKTTRTKDKEKIAVWIDKELLAGLRAIKENPGIPMSKAINDAIKTYLADWRRKHRK
jgi:metal-responsive CopG/Arc/MetJ family transcriptional regulator